MDRMEKMEPLWSEEMRSNLLHMAEELTESLHGWEERELDA